MLSANLLFQHHTFKTRKDSRSSVITRIPLSTAQIKLLAHKRIAVNIAERPVQDALIRAGTDDQLRRLGRPVPIGLGDAQAVAYTDDVGGPVAAGAFDLEGAGGGFGAVDVCDVDGFCAVVDDELGGDGVGGGRECYHCSGGEGGEVHGCFC